jgi:predicted DNA-binding transcriptional regulator AlpA
MTEPNIARRIEAEQTYSAEEAAAKLGISRATFFRLAWFKTRKVRTSKGTVGYLAGDIHTYQTLNRGQ